MTIVKSFFSTHAVANLGLVRVAAALIVESGGSLQASQIYNYLLIEGASNRAALDASLRLAASIGFFKVQGDWSESTVVSTESLDRNDIHPASISGTFLRSLSNYTVQEIQSDGRIPDLSLALAWLMRSDPRRPFSSWGSVAPNDPEIAVRRSGVEELIANDTQWNPFRRWAHALGFGVSLTVGTATYLDPVPRVAVGGSLPPAGSYEARPFLTGLSRQLPFLPTGDVGRYLQSQFQTLGDVDSDLSPAETLALLLLEDEGKLKLILDRDADAQARLALADLGQSLKTISAVEVCDND